MSDPEPIIRKPTDAEKDVAAWIETQETNDIDNLEAGARQIISLVTALFGVVFGILALGKDKFEASLQLPWVVVPGLLAVFLLLIALLLALMVVMPREHSYREGRLDDMRAVFREIRQYKAGRLQWAVYLFAGGVVAFAVMIAVMLLVRV